MPNVDKVAVRPNINRANALIRKLLKDQAAKYEVAGEYKFDEEKWKPEVAKWKASLEQASLRSKQSSLVLARAHGNNILKKETSPILTVLGVAVGSKRSKRGKEVKKKLAEINVEDKKLDKEIKELDKELDKDIDKTQEEYQSPYIDKGNVYTPLLKAVNAIMEEFGVETSGHPGIEKFLEKVSEFRENATSQEDLLFLEKVDECLELIQQFAKFSKFTHDVETSLEKKGESFNPLSAMGFGGAPSDVKYWNKFSEEIDLEIGMRQLKEEQIERGDLDYYDKNWVKSHCQSSDAASLPPL